jgi:hypothetical protein
MFAPRNNLIELIAKVNKFPKKTSADNSFCVWNKNALYWQDNKITPRNLYFEPIEQKTCPSMAGGDFSLARERRLGANRRSA